MKVSYQTQWTKVAGFALKVLTLIAVLGYSVGAQSQEAQKSAMNAADEDARRPRSALAAPNDPDVEQMKERLKQ